MSGTSQPTAAFGGQTYRVRVATSTQPAWFTIGGTPTATTTASSVIPAGWVEDFDCLPGQKAAALEAGTAGTISITELT
jgi:hypothetical protein